MNPTNQLKSYYQIKRSHNAQGRNRTAEGMHPVFKLRLVLTIQNHGHKVKDILKFFKGIKT